VDGIRKDIGLGIPNLKGISKNLGDVAQLKKYGAFVLLLTPDRIFFL
jgi:hypothetical protein